jgi:cell division protein FtsZ
VEQDKQATNMYELIDDCPSHGAIIKVIGVGGGGGHAVQYMADNHVDGVEFIFANTDAQALQSHSSHKVLQLGRTVTRGLGAGANPEIGRQAAEEDRDRISESLTGADMVFITAGMGGGTGTGASPIVAEIAKELGILTVAVVTKPFPFEGRKRMQIANQGIQELIQHVDSLITIPNEKLLPVLGKSISAPSALRAPNEVLKGAVQGIADLILHPGMINVDFADVRTVMSEMGMAIMGTGVASGENRAREAAEIAIRSPLLEDVNLQGAKGILVNITAGENISLGEFTEVGDTIEEFYSENATVILGMAINQDMTDDIRVTIVATGLGEKADDKFKAVKVPLVRGVHDYNQFDTPPSMRKERSPSATPEKKQKTEVLEQQGEKASANSSDANMDYLDIPAFLRRQGD